MQAGWTDHSINSSFKALGVDKISAHIIKDSLQEISSLIYTRIVNDSLASGIFPGGWKQAEVTLFPKDGHHKQPFKKAFNL